ncbi:MAG: hypothetical protein ACK53Y_10475, partial [bacterium]
PVNGSQLFTSISIASGQRYYPLPDHPHYILLELHKYAYLRRQLNISDKLEKQSIQSSETSEH